MRPSSRRAAVGAGLALACLWSASVPARGEVDPPRGVWLDVAEPAAGAQVEGPIDWVRVAGSAASGRREPVDLVLLVDVSGSTAYASGTDVDGDGKVGRARKRRDTWRTFNPRHLSSDADDTILAAELVALARLVGPLDQDDTRLGLVAFHEVAEISVPLGGDRQALQQGLAQLQGRFGGGRTDVGQALRTAIAMLEEATPAAGVGDAEPEARRRFVILLSDGEPTIPGSLDQAAESARAAAREASAAGVTLLAFDLGDTPEARRTGDSGVLIELAELTGGRGVRLERPGDVVTELPRVQLVDAADVEITNETTGRAGLAIRVGADGSFDGYVPLADGRNQIRIEAHGQNGGWHSEVRVVNHRKRVPSSAEEAARFGAELEDFRLELQTRTVEAELLREARSAASARAGSERELEIAVDAAVEETATPD